MVTLQCFMLRVCLIDVSASETQNEGTFRAQCWFGDLMFLEDEFFWGLVR